MAAKIPKNFRSCFTLGVPRRLHHHGETQSVNDIRTAIRELSARAELARKEDRPEDAAELDLRIAGYREQLASRP